MMTEALGTLPFLATLWLLVVLGAKVLEESGAKIAAALKGELEQPTSFLAAPARVRSRKALQTPMRASAQRRAAA
jgi:hypothetical protein